MVDLDAETSILSCLGDSDSEIYDQDEVFWLYNLLLFSLRNGFIKGAQSVLDMHELCSAKPPPLACWCVRALSTRPETNDTGNSSSTASIIDRTALVLATAGELFSELDPCNRFYKPLKDYIEKARLFLVNMHLEAYVKHGCIGKFFAEVNHYLPASSPDPVVKQNRLKIAKMLLSKSRTKAYVLKRWLPNREKAFEELRLRAKVVASQLPVTLIDTIGTDIWRGVSHILANSNSSLALAIRELLRDKSECTEEDILALCTSHQSQSPPSLLF